MANFDLQFNVGEDNRVHVPRIALRLQARLCVPSGPTLELHGH